MAPESIDETLEGAEEALEIPGCIFYRENIFKGRWSRGWFHKLRWIHLKVDVKMKEDGSIQDSFSLVDHSSFRLVKRQSKLE